MRAHYRTKIGQHLQNESAGPRQEMEICSLVITLSSLSYRRWREPPAKVQDKFYNVVPDFINSRGQCVSAQLVVAKK